MKTNYIIVLSLLLCLSFFTNGCVETITDPPDKLAPRLDVWEPTADDTVRNGRNYISFYAEDNIGINYCEVYVNDVLNNSFEADSSHNLPKIYFSIDESFINSRINYFVKVYDLWGNATSCDVINNIMVIENTFPPEVPENFNVNSINDKVIKLTWTDLSDNESGFQIWKRDENKSYELFRTIPANIESTYDSNIVAGKIFYYKICSYNKFGKSNYSYEINSAGMGPLNTPANLTATALGTNQIKLTWDDKSTKEIRFKIERKNTGDQYFAHLVYVDSNKTEYIDRYNMYAGGSYTYRIAAQSNSAISAWSKEVDAITLSENVSAPTNLTATLNTIKKSVMLEWNDYNYNSTEAKIERRSSTSNFVQIASIPATAKSYEDSQITAGNNYVYRVRIITGQGNYSLYSNEASINIPILPPAAPTELKLFRFSETYYNLQWKDNSDDESGFQLWRSDGTPDNFRIIKQLNPDEKAYNDQVNNSSIIYFYKLRAFRDTVFSGFSNLINSTGGSGVYPRPGSFKVQGLCPGQVYLSWTDFTNDELGFKIERKTSWSTFTQIALLPPDSETFIDKNGLTPGVEYIYRIKVFNSTQESDWSDEVNVIVPSTGDCGD